MQSYINTKQFLITIEIDNHNDTNGYESMKYHWICFNTKFTCCKNDGKEACALAIAKQLTIPMANKMNSNT